MESTTDLNEAAGKVRSRRVLLAGAVGGLAAWLAAAAQRAMPAEASAGDPVLAGRSNSGGRLQHRAARQHHQAHLPRRPARRRACCPRRGDERASGYGHCRCRGHRRVGLQPEPQWRLRDHRQRLRSQRRGWGEWLRTPRRRESVLRSGPGHGPCAASGAPVGVTLQETSGSPSLSANQARLFARNNGVGKTQVCVEFRRR